MISNHPKYLTGRAKFEAQDFQGALDDYNLVLKDEENPNIYSERGVVYYHLKQLKRSLSDMDHAADLDPENPYRYSSRAYIKDAVGDTEGAIVDYKRAIALDPEDSVAHNNLGLLQEKLGYKDRAKKNYERADQLADVDKLLNRIQREENEAPAEQQSEPKVDNHPTEGDDLRQVLRQTFTTRNGFMEYLRFIRNGFRQR